MKEKQKKNQNLLTAIILFLGIIISLLPLGIFPGILLAGIGFFLMWKRATWPIWIKIILTLPFIIGLILVFFSILYMFVQPFTVVGKAMEPIYKDGQFVATKILRENEEIERGQIVVIDSDIALIKRVIGLPNEKVLLENGQVKINGNILDESGYLAENISTSGGKFLEEGVEKIIPEDHYFVLGDNREISMDSRAFGFFPREEIFSKVLFCYWNCDR